MYAWVHGMAFPVVLIDQTVRGFTSSDEGSLPLPVGRINHGSWFED